MRVFYLRVLSPGYPKSGVFYNYMNYILINVVVELNNA